MCAFNWQNLILAKIMTVEYEFRIINLVRIIVKDSAFFLCTFIIQPYSDLLVDRIHQWNDQSK